MTCILWQCATGCSRCREALHSGCYAICVSRSFSLSRRIGFPYVRFFFLWWTSERADMCRSWPCKVAIFAVSSPICSPLSSFHRHGHSTPMTTIQWLRQKQQLDEIWSDFFQFLKKIILLVSTAEQNFHIGKSKASRKEKQIKFNSRSKRRSRLYHLFVFFFHWLLMETFATFVPVPSVIFR